MEISLQLTTKRASIAMFLQDDKERTRALRDGFESFFQPLTELFAMKLAPCVPHDPTQIFGNFKNNFSSNIRNKFRSQLLSADVTTALRFLLMDIQNALSAMSRCIVSQFGFSALQSNSQQLALLRWQLTPSQLWQLANNLIPQFTFDQR